MASVYRELMGWVFCQGKSTTNSMKKRLNKDENLIETYVGQSGAFRTSLLRRNLVGSADVSLSKAVDRKYSFKSKLDENN